MPPMLQPDTNPNESRWIYLKVAERIRQEILSGTYKAGRRLPGEPALAERFGVGRITIARALDVLEQSNLIFRVRGSGTYIQRDVARGTARLTIGYLVHDMDVLRNQPTRLALEAAHQALEAHGHTVRLLTRSELLTAGKPQAILRRMTRSGALNGLILSFAMYPDTAHAINDALPMVVLLNDYLASHILNVAVDFAHGYFLATRHLLDLGHRRIGLLGGYRDRSVGYRAVQAFRLACHAQRLDPDGLPMDLCGFSPEAYAPAAERMLRDHPDLTGLVCVDDAAAGAAIAVAASLGRSVPRDLSVAGCNDFPPLEGTAPPLTTLRIDFARMGRTAVDMLLDRIFGRTGPTRIYIQPELVVRASTGPPPPP